MFESLEVHFSLISFIKTIIFFVCVLLLMPTSDIVFVLNHGVVKMIVNFGLPDACLL